MLMNKCFQELVINLSNDNLTLLTALLCDQNPQSWKNNKQLLISVSPRLTLEMAITQTSPIEKNEIPDPNVIYKALKYAVCLKEQNQPPLKIASNY